MEPKFDYMLCEEVKDATGAVTQSDISDNWQKYKVLAVGPGRYDHGIFIEPPVRVGETIHVQRHAEADTPPELREKGQALIMASRVMAVEL